MKSKNKHIHDDLMDLRKLTIAIDKYNFSCEAGPLKNCIEWQKIKKLLKP